MRIGRRVETSLGNTSLGSEVFVAIGSARKLLDIQTCRKLPQFVGNLTAGISRNGEVRLRLLLLHEVAVIKPDHTERYYRIPIGFEPILGLLRLDQAPRRDEVVLFR